MTRRYNGKYTISRHDRGEVGWDEVYKLVRGVKTEGWNVFRYWLPILLLAFLILGFFVWLSGGF